MTARSDLTLTPARLEGWQRSWSARYEDHGCTYVGARPVEGCTMTGAIVPVEIDAALRHRERKYTFRQIDLGRLSVPAASERPDFGPGGEDAKLFVLHIDRPRPPDSDHPIAQSYVDTCLEGCFEIGGEAMAQSFLLETDIWTRDWIDDRSFRTLKHPASPRFDAKTHTRIDALLEALQLLPLREGR